MKIDNKTPFLAEALPMLSHEGNPVLVVLVKGTFCVGTDGAVTSVDTPIPVAYGDEPCHAGNSVSARWESDVVPFKPRGDIVLTGKVHAPGERPAQWLDATLRVGPMIKSLRVFGDRKWVCDGRKLTAKMTPPIPFQAMDLVPERAFGGMDGRTGATCAENPAGRGYFEQEVVEDPEKTFLPNIEDPKNLIRHWKDHPRPVGLGVFGKGCSPRYGYLGTYDEAWEKERAPLPPVDFRTDFNNAAQPDLQVPGYLKGDEELELVNLTHDGRLRFRLPGVLPAVAVTRADIENQGWDAPRATENVEMRLDTLCLIPEERRFFLVWRGALQLRNLGALEIREISIQG